MSTRADRKLLAVRFPLAFAPTGGKRLKTPLKIGIETDLIDWGVTDLAGFPLSAHRIQAAVRSYKAGPRYQKALAKGGARIDLDGKPCGYVSTRHQEQAQRLIAAMDREEAA